MILIDLSDDDMPHHESGNKRQRLQEDMDAQLALRLQREEEAVPLGALNRRPTTDDHASSDAALAIMLQREEDGRAAAQASSVSSTCRASSTRSGDEAATSVPPVLAAEAPPVSADAVALLHHCLSHAKDIGRSEVLLCGATPLYVQHRCKRRSSVSRVPQVDSSVVGEGSGGARDVAMPNDYWTCGYRNVQILVGHLLQRRDIDWTKRCPLFGGKVPDVQSLQMELERLWALGYDPDGRRQLGGSVLGTRKWIGTSEACVLLRGQAVRCNIVAFRGGGDGSEEQDAVSAAAAVVERARRHFKGGLQGAASDDKDFFGRGVMLSAKPPLYLQHDGHSRTIVGIQRRREAGGACTDFLLVLDPGLGPHGFHDFQACVTRGYGWERFIKRSLAPLQKKAEYELLVVEDPSSPIGLEEMANCHCVSRNV